MVKILKIWLRFTVNSFQLSLTRKRAALFVLGAKFLRIGLFVFFLSSFLNGSNGIAGYSREQIIFFYLTFNIVDSASQLLFREVYRFRQLVITGSLDYVLVKPLNPLVRVLFGGADVFDLIILLVLLGVTTYYAYTSFHPTVLSWLLYVVLVLNSIVVAAAFHIFVLGMGILTTTVDHIVMVYRDLTSMTRIPVDLYIEPVRFLITFIIPLGVMVTFPAKILLGLLSPQLFILSLVVTFVMLVAALRFWQFSLHNYQSASS